MLCIYTPALLVSSFFLMTSPAANGREHLASCLLLAHFGKRVLETLFLHKYSGTMELQTASFIGGFYAFISAACLFQQRSVLSYGGDFPVGSLLAVFAVGQLGNLYHHYLLSRLRTGPGTGYVVPTGGLFSLCTSPHYFFELLSWFSFALVCNHLNVFLTAMGMTSYLAGRSVSNQRWSAEKFGEKWKAKKNMIPFIF
jgi:very-long-chain enoyl-CoA reductase